METVVRSPYEGPERRNERRMRALKSAKIAFNFGRSVIDCTVRNISASGARIDIANPVGVPESFMLVIEADQFMRRCRAVWSHEQRIGVTFD